jgi:hypothetical protein
MPSTFDVQITLVESLVGEPIRGFGFVQLGFELGERI